MVYETFSILQSEKYAGSGGCSVYYFRIIFIVLGSGGRGVEMNKLEILFFFSNIVQTLHWKGLLPAAIKSWISDAVATPLEL